MRFAGFYGPDDFARTFVATVRKGWSPLPGSPDAFASSVMHDDAASAVLAALGARAGAYNVVDDEPLRRRDYVTALASRLGVDSVKYTPRWAARMLGSIGELLSRSQRISNEKLKRETGWKPTYPSAREGWASVLQSLAG
jgi:nucleoside-diphosphate-sugar epimerase